ncbi:MAG: SMC-Scp complex subunit ScpB [Spirochaetes bacterium]|nr:SMC-Scp complex subunit ScpB [Spirochaetota bacterium]
MHTEPTNEKAREPSLERETALVETIFFLETDPIDVASISRVSGLGKDVVERVIENLESEYSGPSRGMELLKIGGGYTLAPKRDYWNALKEKYGRKSEARMSRAALETLSIIAYSQPVTRSEIEAIRGVSADNMIRFLVERELIKEVGKKDVLGKPTQYGTTKDFLKFFRLDSIADLPKLDELERERFELENEE